MNNSTIKFIYLNCLTNYFLRKNLNYYEGVLYALKNLVQKSNLIQMNRLRLFKFRIGESSPKFLFMFLIFLILVMELIIMFAFDILDYKNYFINASIDATLLVIMITPFLYYFFYKPSIKYVRNTKKVEERLQDERLLLRTVIDNIPYSIYGKDISGRNTLANFMELKYLGAKSEEEILGKTDFDFYPKEIAEAFFNDDKFVIQTGKAVINREEYLIDKKGDKKVLLTSKVPLKDEYGNIKGIVGIGHDITERKRVEESLQKLNLAISNSQEIIFMTDNDGIFTFVNPTFTKIYGFTEEEVVGKTTPRILNSGFFTKEDFKSFWDKIPSKQSVPKTEYRNKCKDGKLIDIEGSVDPIINANGDLIGFLGIHRDITKRKLAEETIRESEEKFKNAFQYSAIGIALISPAGKWLKVNLKVCEMVGYSEEELLSLTFQDITHPDDLTTDLDFVKQLLAGEIETYSMEKRYLHKQGDIIWVLLSVSLVRDKDGAPLFFISQIRDVTDRKRAEKEIQETNEELIKINNEKDKFFSIIAHDLKSPFNSIVGFSELLLEQIKANDYDEIEKHTEIILQSSQTAMDLLKNLMEWSQSQTGRLDFNPEFFELVEVIKDVERLLIGVAEQKSIKILKTLPSNAPIIADKDMISTILRNLVSNAIKFTNTGGKITIAAQDYQNKLTISVHDTGIGIPPEAIDKLFNIDSKHSTYGTQNEKGTGLGLILCKEFVEKHGGKIWVESEEGNGSTFYFTLPHVVK